ncbi:MAG: hypothetical protein M0Q29_06660 [Thiopseudomonas sp.]|nr:hypothetical protein [Thiopseudomonas sp.]MCK9465551.1 hypothetical protein [Thiopseudomonas sp.]
MSNIEAENLPERMRAAISLGWVMFSRKVGNGLIPINKEASMQLQYAYVLQQMLPLITFRDDEKFEIELETGVRLDGRNREIDLLFRGEFGNQQHSIAIEMKCYRTFAASGGKRGASDIFMKDVYEDLQLLEQYVSEGFAQEGVALVMNDMERLVNPSRKEAKCWDYDISHGSSFGPIQLTTPVGGKDINIHLAKKYSLTWINCGGFWFLEAQGENV